MPQKIWGWGCRFICVTPQKCGKKCQKRHFLQFFDAYIFRDCEIQKFWLVMLQGHIPHLFATIFATYRLNITFLRHL